MARKKRRDDPGSIHHIFNRGIAKRTMFETRRDKRFFLSLAARSVRRGELKIFAFCIMTTHFHLLVQSVDGQLDVAMRRIQTEYSRNFNRARHRDGGLVRGRYSSKRVESNEYFWAATVYIEANAQMAKICRQAEDYEFSSAHHRHVGVAPRWLDTDHWGTRPSAKQTREKLRKLAELMEARLIHASTKDEVDSLAQSKPPRVLEWMKAKADLADQTKIGLPVTHYDDLHHSWNTRLDEIRELPRPRRSAHKTNEQAMLCGLAFYLCGLSQREIGEKVGHSPSSAGKLLAVFRQRLATQSEFGAVASEIASKAIRSGPLGPNENCP